MRWNLSHFTRSAHSFYLDWKEFVLKKRFFRIVTITSCVIFAFTILLPIWKIVPLRNTTPFIPLHYNVYNGIDSIGPWYHVFILPTIGFSFLVLNTVMQAVLGRNDTVLPVFFALSALAVQLILFVAMLFILLLNV